MGVFFISWQLWEEMTFVLGCAIIVVFLIGIYKLWRTSQQVRRQEVIDEEKRARLTEMRKAGVPPTRPRKFDGPSDIPFGVRAIQTGVEVDGIWISQPTTPSHNSSSSRLLASEAGNGTTAGDRKGKGVLSGEYRPYPGPALDHPISQRDAQVTTASTSSHASAANEPQAPGSSFVDAHSNLSTPLPRISENATLSNSSSTSALNEEALRRLEGTYAPTGFAAPGSSNAALLRSPFLNTYIPSSRMSSPSPSPSANRDSLSSNILSSSRPRHDMPPAGGVSVGHGNHPGQANAGVPGWQSSRSSNSNSIKSRSSTSSRQASSSDKRTTQPAADQQSNSGTLPTMPTMPATSPENASYRGYYTHPVPSPASSRYSAPPLATAFPGDARANRVSRKINPSFEVLPAGTFAGQASGIGTGSGSGSGSGTRRGSLAGGQNATSSNGSNADDEADTPPPTAAATSRIAPPMRNKLRRTSGPDR